MHVQIFLGKIDNNYPKDKLLQFASMHAFVYPVNLPMQPIENVLTIFTDGSSNGKALYVIGSHVHSLEFLPASAQIIVLHAVAAVFEMLKNQAFNLYTDSQYIAHGLQLLEIVPFLDTANSQILQLFMQIQLNLRERTVPYFVGHLRAHTQLPGPLSEGSAKEDLYTRKVVSLTQEQLAKQSHSFHHQNNNSLRQQIGISRECTCQIIKTCTECPQFLPVPHNGVNT